MSVAAKIRKTVEEIEGMSLAAFRETLAFHQVRREQEDR